MFKSNKLSTIAGWLVFAIAFVVYFLSAERTGSLWDCGEFILGAYKLQVVHPPGAPLFMIIGRIFTVFAELVSNNPEDIAFSVNLMSGICSAFAVTFVAWTTSMFAKMAFVGRSGEMSEGQTLAAAGSGLVAGLIGAFCTSIWFSAVEGEVYAMSTFFTAMTIYAAAKWYSLPDDQENDRWLVFSLFAAGLSVGVHLLSLLALPAIGLLFYYKKYKEHNIVGGVLSMLVGVVFMWFIQKLIVVGVPSLWASMEIFCVNKLGLPFHTGLIPTALLLGGLAFFLLRYAHNKNYRYLQLFTVVASLNVIAFSLIGVIVIRANADTPINMNVPSDAVRLLPYINREQYGERPLLYGPHFEAKAYAQDVEDRYGRVGDEYVVVDKKVTNKYKDKDKIFFPRVSDASPQRKAIYRAWWGKDKGTPTQAFNMSFLFQYQIGWMYWRYFMWNFAGRQNGEQGYFNWDKSSGNWQSGINFIDKNRLYDTALSPDKYKDNKANNKYYFIPLILGLIGMFWQMFKRPKDFFYLFTLFIITGIGIIIYSNQPPNEPRERDYVLIGSFLTFAMWGGLAVAALYDVLKDKIPTKGIVTAGLFTAVCLVAPAIMLQQNFDDHSRREHYASRDYASNFLNSVDENAIIFTYGDNDTYPLWYAQEVEGIRTDVRVVNLSLIAVDWYINKLTSKVNDSPALKMTISRENYRGMKRQIIPFVDREDLTDLNQGLELANSDKRLPQYNAQVQGYWPSRRMMIRPNREKAIELGLISANDSTQLDPIIFDYKGEQFTYKDDTAILDVIGSNIWDRPIYFAVTCENSKLQGINDYMRLEGLALRIVPFKNPGDDRGGVAYSGSLDTEKAYENIMTKWAWGNFDKKDLFIDDSYGAALMAMRTVMVRTATTLIAQGEKEKAGAISKKFFESFPNFNFHYSYDVLPFLDVMIRADELEEAKKHITILAEETRQNLDFLNSLDRKTLEESIVFSQDYRKYNLAAQDLQRLTRSINDTSFTQNIESLLGPYAKGAGNLN